MSGLSLYDGEVVESRVKRKADEIQKMGKIRKRKGRTRKRTKNDPYNPFDAKVVQYSVMLGTLREHWYPRQTSLTEPSKKQFERGRFRTITTDGGRHIMLRGKEKSSVLGYIVPAECIMTADYRDSLAAAVEQLPKISVSQNKVDVAV
jgi:hypothetical protein